MQQSLSIFNDFTNFVLVNLFLIFLIFLFLCLNPEFSVKIKSERLNYCIPSLLLLLEFILLLFGLILLLLFELVLLLLFILLP